MRGDRSRRWWKAATLLAVGIAVGVMMTATPTMAHVTGSLPHLIKHLKKTFVTKKQAERSVLFGNFEGDDGSLIRGQGVASSEREDEGFYIIDFNRNIQKCALLASPSSTDALNPSSVTVGAAYWSTLFPRRAFVLIRQNFADDQIDADFALAALC